MKTGKHSVESKVVKTAVLWVVLMDALMAECSAARSVVYWAVLMEVM